MAILDTHNLAIGYRRNKKVATVISDINISLAQGELVCLIGANGIGKSTLLRTIAGSQHPLNGTVRLNNRDLKDYSKGELSKLLGLVYTDSTHAGGLTVFELVSLGRQPHTGFLGKLKDQDYKIINESLIATGIEHKKNSFIAELSDGERQKTMIAKALSQETPVILLDEPTAFLDIASKIETMRLLSKLAHENNKAILLSSHDISQSLLMADKLWIIDQNHKIREGVTEDLILNKHLDSVFPNPNITFDYQSGDFRMQEEYKRKVKVEGDSTLLIHWCENALRKNGYGIDNTDYSMQITIASPKEILIDIPHKETTKVTSVGELILFLSRY